jgi:hypothetical protein
MRIPIGISALMGLLMLAGCDRHSYAQTWRIADPATIRIALPESMGTAERPAVDSGHQVHAKALKQEGCAICHSLNSNRQVLPRLNFKTEPSDADAWMQSHHELCIDCHDDRRQAGKSTGPDDCGECHVKRQTLLRDADREMRFDYSLHYRHVTASKEKCEDCHHVYDEKQGKLVYQKGAEDTCSACHRPVATKDETSLSDAVHTSCINCHIEKQGKRHKSGPQLCAGCHGAEEQAKFGKFKHVPPPDRDQPEALWIASKGSTTGAVPFDHKLHERQVDSCSSCHHESIGKCGDCHKQLPQPEGGGISLSQAFHEPDSTLSCVGCHRENANRGECAGCHHMLPTPPSQSACDLCHSGPQSEKLDRNSSPMTLLADREFPALPAVSEDFPEEIAIKSLADRYQPVKFPHKQIVTSLDRVVCGNQLAERFHQNTETLCAGCHHNNPPGDPVPACRSCHGDENDSQKDLPDLKAAYHRQCIGCHQAIGHEAQGCTDCHEELRK